MYFLQSEFGGALPKDKKHGIDYIRFPTSIRSYNGCKVFVERADLLLLIFHYAQPTFTPA